MCLQILSHMGHLKAIAMKRKEKSKKLFGSSTGSFLSYNNCINWISVAFHRVASFYCTMDILDVISLYDVGIVIAFLASILAMIAGILWVTRVRQKQTKKAKAKPPRWVERRACGYSLFPVCADGWVTLVTCIELHALQLRTWQNPSFKRTFKYQSHSP